MLTHYMHQERREEEDMPALKTAMTLDNNIEKQEVGLITATRNDTEKKQQKTEIQ